MKTENGNFVGFIWKCASSDGASEGESAKVFATQAECYADMVKAATGKVAWDVEFDDVTSDIETYTENGVLKTDAGKGWAFNRHMTFQPHRITHKSDSCTYTYEIEALNYDERACKRIAAVLGWITKADGYDGAIGKVTDAYTDGDTFKDMSPVALKLWQDKYYDKWQGEIVPATPEIEGMTEIQVEELALNIHRKLAIEIDKISREIADANNAISGKECVGAKIIEGFVDQENTKRMFLYTYVLDNRLTIDSALDECEDMARCWLADKYGRYEEIEPSVAVEIMHKADKYLADHPEEEEG